MADNTKRFGISTQVEPTLEVLQTLKTKDTAELSKFWNRASSDVSKKVLFFHMLSYLDRSLLDTWLDSTPKDWWAPNKQSKLAMQYSGFAGGMLHHLHVRDCALFHDIVQRHPHLLQGSSCGYYVEEWCKSAQNSALFQDLLLKQPAAWYARNPSRVHFLISMDTPHELELMLAAALASNGQVHKLMLQRYPGLDACINVSQSLSSSTKEHKKFVLDWMSKQGQEVVVQQFELPTLG